MNLDPELIEELKRLEAEMNAPKPEKEYRFYYDANGQISARAEFPPYPSGNKYIVITEQVYQDARNYQVLNGVAVRILREHNQIKTSLVKGDSGFRVVKGNAALFLEEDEEYRDTEYYDRRTS